MSWLDVPALSIATSAHAYCTNRIVYDISVDYRKPCVSTKWEGASALQLEPIARRAGRRSGACARILWWDDDTADAATTDRPQIGATAP